jgi:hypothetical protein
MANKVNMKLYTEDQIRDALDNEDFAYIADIVIAQMDPIEEKGKLVRLLRWVLKHYSTATDADGFFMWENPTGEEFDSMQVVDHYLKENK